jgi:hypothetical protein
VSFRDHGAEYSNTTMGESLFDVAAKALEFFCAPNWKGPRPRRNTLLVSCRCIPVRASIVDRLSRNSSGIDVKLTVPGIALGLAGAIGLTRLIRRMLYGVPPVDPLTFSIASVVLMGVALAACYFPARRAMSVDPVKALRNE